jgi:NhaP-type Na+/H+ or K+/H+ antiporter
MVSLESPPVALLLILLTTVAVVAALVRYIRIPYSVALGGVLGLLPNTPALDLTPGVILTVFLPVLLFYGAYHLDLADLWMARCTAS